MCGENRVAASIPAVKPGSSPRVRGKRCPAALAIVRGGLIPACAGKTNQRAASARVARAHPRVCGENENRDRRRLTLYGSSPRVRGKQAHVTMRFSNEGLIPACAGKTCPPPPRAYQSPAHPRVCGENPSPTCRPQHPRGSSPRVRGKRNQRIKVKSEHGLIPACAGKTSQVLRLQP